MGGSSYAASSSFCDDSDVGEEAAAVQMIGEVRLGDLIWVELNARTRWPAQVVDEKRVCRSSKPGKKVEGGIPVRLYGSNEYLYADPMKRCSEFKMKGGDFEEIFEKVLKRVSSHANSRRSKGQETKFAGIRNKRVGEKDAKMETSKQDKSKPKNKNAKEESRKSSKQGEQQRKRMPGNVKQEDMQKKRKLNKALRQSERRMRVMQSLALIAPVGSPFSSLN